MYDNDLLKSWFWHDITSGDSLWIGMTFSLTVSFVFYSINRSVIKPNSSKIDRRNLSLFSQIILLEFLQVLTQRQQKSSICCYRGLTLQTAMVMTLRKKKLCLAFCIFFHAK